MKKTRVVLLAVLSALGGAAAVRFLQRTPVPLSAGEATPGQKKILFYHSPMNPGDTSPTPKKDSMGMDYLPVYAEEGAPIPAVAGRAAVNVSPYQQQLANVRVEPAARRKLVRGILAYARVAYDPELYSAEQEYLSALELARASQRGSAGLVRSARQRLTLLGLGPEQIDELTKRGRVDEGLLLGGKAGTAWAYASVFASDLPYIHVGQPVRLSAPGWPQGDWRGRVASIDPVVDANTRTTRVRIELPSGAPALRPDTYLDAAIEAELGTALAVPSSAVLDTGREKLVFVDQGGGSFVPRMVKVGRVGDDYVEALSGVAAGEKVVVNGNFLLDSESQVRGASSAAEVQP
jgi:Cu(I)/Ag(I) efflux system membrane fusion protein